MTHAFSFFNQTANIANQINSERVEEIVDKLIQIRSINGRLFILGVGGSAANASHAVNDFRKLCAIETYAPTDNVSELTARTNDDGWETVFSEWLKISHLNKNDGILVFSVGGGNREKNVSVNIINALDHAKFVGATIMGIIGRDGGYTGEVADVAVIIPTIDPSLVTPHTEAYQAVVWHCMVSHPKLQIQETKW